MYGDYSPGEIVVSTAGRDKGKYYIVTKVKSDYLLLADGAKKRLDNPKRKNLKHVKSTGTVIDELSIWLKEKKRLKNEDVQVAIREYINKEEAN